MVENYFNYINKRFTVSFTEHNTPPVLCPHCSTGEIKLDNATFSFEENPDSKALHSDPDFEVDWIKYRYSGSFLCPNCNGRTYSCGTGRHYEIPSQGPDDEYEDFPVFYPKYFEPTIPLFRIHNKCPKPVQDLLFSSFKLAWTDVSASANKLRIAIETLLNTIDPELEENKVLHKRIEAFSKSQPEVAELLMAIKWLGNEASHGGALEEYDLAFAYEVMELSINRLFDDTEDKIKQLVELVNKKKGKPFQEW